MRQTWWLHFSESQLPIHQEQYFSSISVWSLYRNSQLVHLYAILWHVRNAETLWKEVRCWHKGYSNKPTLFLGENHCSKNSTAYITNRLPNCNKSFPCLCIFFSIQNHQQDFDQTWVLVESLVLIFSVVCVLFVFDLCIVCQLLITTLVSSNSSWLYLWVVHDLVECYGLLLSQITTGMFCLT